MNLNEDIALYLPKYLSSTSERELIISLQKFPENIDSRMYTNHLVDRNVIFQGDGIKDLLVINLPDKIIKPINSIIVSNTCDIAIENVRNFPSQIVYAPIFNLSKYETTLLKNTKKPEENIHNHILAIKRQEVTQIFYLPKFADQLDESIVFLDRLCNCKNQHIDRTNLNKQRLFTLSDYGIYLFILKLSIHFTRIQDKIERKAI